MAVIQDAIALMDSVAQNSFMIDQYYLPEGCDLLRAAAALRPVAESHADMLAALRMARQIATDGGLPAAAACREIAAVCLAAITAAEQAAGG